MKLRGALLAVASAVTTVRATGLADGGCSYSPPPPPPTTTPPPPPTTTPPPPPPPVDCELYSALTDPSPWGPCKQKGDTNKYYRTKVLGIKTEPQNGGKPCPAETDPVRNPEDLCAPIDCVPFTQAEDNLPWGDCTNDGTGKFVKTRVHGIKVPPQNGGDCDVEKRTDREVCAAVACEVFTVDEDKGPYSTCAPDTTAVPIKYIQWKVLGIKKPAENGGSCPSEAQRNTTLVCPPENCVPFSKAEDQGEYSKCFLQAGKYIKTKTLGVKTPEKNGGTCDPKDRLVEEPCAAIDCVLKTRAEDDGPFSNCTDFFNNGTYYRSKVLGIKVQPENGGAACPAETDLARIALDFCPPVDCVAVPKDEDTGEFGECFARNGTNSWIRTKILGIKTPPQNGGKCDPKDRTIEEVCPPVNCVVFNATEDPGEFGPCFKDPQSYGLRYIKTKTLGIKTPAKYGGTCPSEDDPVRYHEEVCPPINCVPLSLDEDKGEYSPCAKNETSGLYTKFKVLGIKTEAQNGGTCDPKDRTDIQICPPVNCVVKTEIEDDGPFGNCSNVFNNGTYYKSRILGIKTEPLNGGLPCPAAKDRTVYQFCPPVNCVPLGNDTGTFGNCSDADGDGKWYRSKVLGIKEPAKNGGTCDPKDRTVYDFCQPVNCTRFTEAEDKGSFGNCTLVGYGSYARNKTLGIKTPALYGGACPPVVVTKDCPNDGYCVPWDPNYDTCLTKLKQCGQKKTGWVYTDNLISVTQGIALWQCCDKCATTAGCAAYSYDTSKSKCSLTWKPNEWKFVDGAVTSSPVKPKPATCTYFDDRWLLTFFSATLDEFRTDDLDECCRRCKVTYGCNGFYLSDSNCVLKTQEGLPSWWPGSRAGWARV